WLLLSRTLAAGQAWAVALVLVGLTVTFVAVSTHVGRVLFGQGAGARGQGSGVRGQGSGTGGQGSPSPASDPRPPVPSSWSFAPAVLLSLSLALGVALTPGVMRALTAWTQGGAR